MQPSSAFNILKQLRTTGKWKILDNTSNVSLGQESGASVVSVSDLNRGSELVFKRLKSNDSELEATADDILKVGKENIDVQLMNSIDNFVTCNAGQVDCEHAKHNLLNDGHSIRTDEVDTCDGCDVDAVMKVSNATKKQRRTFSLRTEILPCSTVQLQSDSIDVVNLLGEVADIYQRSSELSYDISTQEIEAHEDKIDGLKQQHCVTSCTESVLPVSHCATQHVNNIDHHRQQADISQLSVNTESIHQPSPVAVTAIACSMTASQLSHSKPASPVKALQYNDVATLSPTVHSDVGNNSSALANNTKLNTLAVSNDNCERLCMPAAGVDIHMCTESPANAVVACRDEQETTDAGVAVVDENSCETKQSYSDEVFSSQVADTSDVESELGEYFTATLQVSKLISRFSV